MTSNINKQIVHDVFEQVSSSFPEKIAVQDSNGQCTYKELSRYSNKVAHALADLGVKKGDIVAVFLNSSVEYISSIIGINKAGAAFLALETEYPANRLKHILQKTSPAVIITNEPLSEQLVQLVTDDGVGEKVILVSLGDSDLLLEPGVGAELNTYPDTAFNAEVHGDDTNYIFYTSGSTGEPKAIVGRHKSLSHFVHWEIKEFQLQDTLKVPQLAPVSFDVSLRDIFVPLLSGGTVCIPDKLTKFQPSALLQWMADNEISLVHCVPSVFRLLTTELENNKKIIDQLSSLQHILLAGEALYRNDVQKWWELMGDRTELVNLYGPSETTLAKLFYRVPYMEEFNDSPIVPLGKPIANTQIIILKNNRLCDVGEFGEICIKTPFVSKGYYNDDELTSARFMQNPLHNDYEDIIYRTGDLGKYRPDRSVLFIGRQDSQVKIMGNRVELSEIEGVISNVEGISKNVVLVVKKDSEEDILVCYYTSASNVDEHAIRDHIVDFLPAYMHPAFYMHLQEFPLNINGKINKKALPQLDFSGSLKYNPPKNKLEAELEDIWKEILGQERVSRDSSFFSIGGSSLKGIKIISRIFQKYNMLIKLGDFFSHPTIAELAEMLGGQGHVKFEEIKKIPEASDYAVSHVQKRLWVIDHFEGSNIAENTPAAFRIRGKLDINALSGAFKTLLERHEILRTTFVTVNEVPRQKIHPLEYFHFEIKTIDLIDNDDKEERTFAIVRDEINAPFDLSNGPLIRATFIKTHPEESVFVFTLHHIISDGWSKQVFINELLSLYNAYRTGQPNPLTPLKIQYKDYTAWQQEQLSGENLTQLRNFWMEQFEEDVPALSLPLDFPRPEIKTFEGEYISFNVEKEQMIAINKLCERSGASQFMVFMAGINIMLFKYSGQGDLVIGAPVAGRDHRDLENQIGNYLNTLAIRSKVDSDLSLKEYLKQVKNECLKALEHQMYPFDMLLEDLALEKDAGRNALFDVSLIFQNMSYDVEGVEGAEGLEVERYDTRLKISKNDLRFEISENENDFHIDLEYDSCLFKKDTVERIRDNFLHILNLLSDSEDQKIKDVSLLISDDEQKHTDEVMKSFM